MAADTPLSARPGRVEPVPLADLAAVAGAEPPAGEVTGITHDSRAVQAGDLYAALPGANVHGAQFAEQALAAGAVAVFTDPAGSRMLAGAVPPQRLLVVAEPRRLLGRLSAQVYGHPARGLLTFGVTGTNGKTTVTYLLEAALGAAGHRVGVIGTTGTRVGERRIATARTTPEAPELQALLAVMVEQGCTAVAMEVSSHALVLGRVDGIRYDVATFTNLSPDHLDFHDGMDDYFAAKRRLFLADHCRQAVICVDDRWGVAMAGAAEVPVTTYSAYGAASGTADWEARNVVSTALGSRFTAQGPAGKVPLSVVLPGTFNVANALGAVATVTAAGVDPAAAAAGVSGFRGVPGRMEVVPDPRGEVAVIVDYAHSPEAVSRAITAVREVTAGRIVCVLGCGGDRDQTKRPDMGRIGAELSDILVVTDDNPRSEDPAVIRAAMLAGAASVSGAEVQEIGSRADAIAWAVAEAVPGDCVLILGKGHETGQEVAGTVYPFDDRAVAAECLGAQ